MSTSKNTTSWLAGLLTGWGIKESWAKLIAGAVIGALTAVGVMTTQSGCSSLTPEQKQNIEGVHDLYHVITGKDCVFEKDATDK